MTAPEAERIRDDLRGLLKGEFLGDDVSRVLYSTDASIFQVKPLGIVVPRDEDDVRALVRYAGDRHLALIPRGAGSGVAGESLGSGLIVDLSRHFRAIIDIGSDTVRVQPGVIYRELNQRLAAVGRRFAPDPASGDHCTVGGMVATNASGARAIKHGYTRDYVVALRAILDNGDAMTLARHSRWPGAESPPGRLEDLTFSIATLLESSEPLIKHCRPRTRFNRCGYLLHDVLHQDDVDMAKLVVGSEGTLALFTELTLRTIPLPGGQGMVLLGFRSLESALKAAQKATATGPSACELLDRRLLSLARGDDLAGVLPGVTEAVLLVEYEADSRAEARRQASELADRLTRQDRLALTAQVAVNDAECERFWALREAALPSLYGLRGTAQPVALFEDVGVPVEELSAYLHKVQELLQSHEITASFLIHAATGQVHTRPFLDLRDPETTSRLRGLADAVYELAFGFGGTISTQHGTGLARTPWVPRQYGPLYPVFRKLKAIFDPRHLFNPGKIVMTDPDGTSWSLRSFPVSMPVPVPDPEPTITGKGMGTGKNEVSSLLLWQPTEMATEAATCNGCGQCRTESPVQRMCPLFRARLTEAASPRAKANLMRHLLQSDPKQLSSDAVREVADLCINCKMCAIECPAKVNIPKLMLEAKAANVAEHGLSRSNWALARAEGFAHIGSVFAVLTNALLASRSARWLLETMFGVSRLRRLPKFSGRSFLHRAKRRGWTRPPRPHRPRVAYFTDVYANYNDPLIGEAVVAVLHHHGIEVYVPPGQVGCGMAPLAHGDVETARETVQRNLRILGDLAREGFTIICSEPTAAVMLKQDARLLLDDPDVALVAERTVELTSFLWNLHRQGRLRTDFRSLDFSVGHHIPCHLKALGGPAAGPDLLELIPGLRVHTIDVSCSGMAGTFGMEAENYAVSLEAGRPMLQELRRPRVLFGSTECSTCRMQMEEGTGKRTLHPIQYMALAYGYLPELTRRLHEPIRDWVL